VLLPLQVLAHIRLQPPLLEHIPLQLAGSLDRVLQQCRQGLQRELCGRVPAVVPHDGPELCALGQMRKRAAGAAVEEEHLALGVSHQPRWLCATSNDVVRTREAGQAGQGAL
jgi:hypothetical protein